jgi:predicted transcriptional regulator
MRDLTWAQICDHMPVMSKKPEPIQLALQVEDFLKETGMSASAFGIQAIGQKPLVYRLRAGKDVTTRTASRIVEFMQQYQQHG